MVTRAPTPPRRAPVTLRGTVTSALPNLPRVIPIDDDGTRVYVPNYSARGNAVARVEAVQPVDVSEDDTPLAPNFYRIAAYEREIVSAVAGVGGDQWFLLLGQREVWEDRDSLGGRNAPVRARTWRSSPDTLYVRPGQRAIWEDADETINSRYSGLRTEGASGANRQKKASHLVPSVRKPQQLRRSTVMPQSDDQSIEVWQGLRDAVCDGLCYVTHIVNEITGRLPPSCGEPFNNLCHGLCGGSRLAARMTGWDNMEEGHGLIHRIISVIAHQGSEDVGSDHQAPLDAIQRIMNEWWGDWSGQGCQEEAVWDTEASQVTDAVQGARNWTYHPVVVEEQEWDWGFLDDLDSWLAVGLRQAALAGIAGYIFFRGQVADQRIPD